MSARQQPLTRHGCVNALCAAGAIAIHALLISPMVLGTGGYNKPRRSDTQGPGASAIVSSAEFVTLVLISEPQAQLSRDFALADLASRGIARADLAVRILSPDPNPAFEFADEDTPEHEPQPIDQSSGNARERALLFERYLTQVYSRVERAWLQPAAPVKGLRDEARSFDSHDAHSISEADDVFDCEVRVQQDANGKVLEIMLIDCDDSIVWQQSLVGAIQHASPLPAPPHPSVFTSVLMLKFAGEPPAALSAGAPSRAHTNNLN